MKYQYCPKCGTKYSEPQNDNAFRCNNCKYVFYQNSKPTVSALIEDGDKILLAKRKIDPSKGMWDIVGGFLNIHEHPENGLHREVLEETGLEVEIIDYLGTTIGDYNFQNENISTLNIIYRARIISGEMQADDDVESLEWFHKDELPTEMAFEDQLVVLKKWAELKS